MHLRAFLQTQPFRCLVCEAIVLVLAIGWLDYLTGREVSLFLLYALPILMVAWYGSRNWALVIALIGALVWWLANLEANLYDTKWGYALAAFTRLFYCIFVAIGGAALRVQQGASKARIEALETTRELEQRIVQASESAQRQIGQELHDGICQHFAAVAFAARALKNELEKRAVPLTNVAGEIESLINDGVVQLRDLARGIFPVQVGEAGLSAALDELAATTDRLMPVAVTFRTCGNFCIPDAEVSMHLYRIAQEALNNAVKHGNAQQIDITLSGDEEKTVLTVSDDGRGFQNAPPKPAGMGMKTMQYRARAIGAELSVGSCYGHGATLICTLPTRGEGPKTK